MPHWQRLLLSSLLCRHSISFTIPPNFSSLQAATSTLTTTANNNRNRNINTNTNKNMATTTTTEDPYIWLEDVEAKECLDFAKLANNKCLEALGDPKTSNTKTYDRVLAVLESKDRIPYASNYGKEKDGQRILYNFWKDEEHPKGVWRRTTMDSYQSEEPEWTTVLDVDELAKKDAISWVWKGSRALPRKRDPMSDNGRVVTRALLSLSRGGSDAVHYLYLSYRSKPKN